MRLRRPFSLVVCSVLGAGLLPFALDGGGVGATLDDPFQAPTIVEDLDTAGASSGTQDMVSVGATLYVLADDPVTSDVTIFEYLAATGAVREVDAVAPGSSPLEEPDVSEPGAALNGELIFAVEGSDPVTSDSVYRINAVTPGGATREVLELPVNDPVRFMTAGDGVVYFAIDSEIWVSDGTSAGTEVVVGGLDRIRDLVVYDRPDGTETLAVIEGSSDTEVTRIDPFTTPDPTVTRYGLSPAAFEGPSDLVGVAGTLYFIARDGDRGLYAVGGDTAPATATLVRDDISWFRASDTDLYVGQFGATPQVTQFDASDTSQSRVVFTGEPGASVRVGPAWDAGVTFRLSPPLGGGVSRRPGGDEFSTVTWWEATGSADATQLTVGGEPLAAEDTSDGGVANGDRSALLLVVDDDTELWHFVPGTDPTRVDPIGEWDGLDEMRFDDRLFTSYDGSGWAFLDTSATLGEEPHLTDGTGVGTTVVDIDPRTEPSNPNSFVPAGDGAELRAALPGDEANDALLGYDPATDAVTEVDLGVPENVRTRGPIVERNGARFYIGIESGDTKLFRSQNGVSTEVAMLFDEQVSDNYVAFTDTHVFVGRGSFDRILWSATLDGVTVTDLGIELRSFVVPFGDGVLFQADLGPGLDEPWFSDGTLAGTLELGDLTSGSPRLGNEWILFGGRSYFSSFGDVWSTDGTPSGTQQAPASFGSSPLVATEAAMLMFDESGQFAVVRGEPAAATAVDRSVVPNGTAIAASRFSAAGEAGSFAAEIELDGVPHLGLIENDALSVVAIGADPDDEITSVALRRGIAYFVLRPDVGPEELWRSDGTPTGTGRIWTQSTDNAINELLIVGDRLIAPLDHPVFGRELFSLDVGPGVPGAPTGVTATRTGRTEIEVSWTAPSADGGTPIEGYVVTAAPGGATCSTASATTCVISGLDTGVSYRFTVTASNDVKTSAASAASAAILLPTDVVSLVPGRFFDSRPNQPDFDGQGRPGVRVAAGETVRVQIAGRGEVPSDASGVVANVTVVRPSTNGFMTVFDCAGDPPTASSLNFRADLTVPNELVAKLSSSGELCIFSTSEAHLLVDVVGVIPDSSSIVSLAPDRFFDSRPNQPDFDGQGRPGARVAAGETVRVQIAGRGDVPAGVPGVVANVTIVRPSTNGFATVFDCAGDPPTASSLNFLADETVPNELVAKLSSAGELCVFSTAETHLLIDVVGAVRAGSDLLSLAPERFYDSRPDQPDLDGRGRPAARVAADEIVRVQIAGRGGVPTDASGVVANVTIVRPSTNGFATVFDCAGDPPTASSLNFRADQTVPNELVAKLSSSGELCVFTTSETHLLIDVVGAIA